MWQSSGTLVVRHINRSILLILPKFNTTQCWHKAVRPTGHICYNLHTTSDSIFQVNLTKQVGSELQCGGTQLRSQTQQQLSWRHVNRRCRWQVYQNQTNVAGHSKYNLGSSCQYVEHAAPRHTFFGSVSLPCMTHREFLPPLLTATKNSQTSSFLSWPLRRHKQVASSLDLYKDTNK